MSHITQAQQGLAAVEARNWDEAVDKLSAALKVSPNPAWLVGRSKALISLKRFQEALDDANLAWHTAYDRNKRPLLVEAHYRRAVAHYRLGEFANADACCVYAMRLVKGLPAVEKEDPARKRTDANGFYLVTLDEAKEEAQNDELNQSKGDLSTAMGGGDKGPAQIKEWRAAGALRTQILFRLDKLAADDPARKLTTGIKPEQKALADHGAAKKPQPAAQPAAAAAPKPAAPSDAPLRLQDFQSQTNMSVSIFSKGVDKDALKVQYLPKAVVLESVVYPSGETKPFRLDLWGEIDTEACKHTVTPNKVELTLKKKTPGKWATLKGEAQEENVDEAAAKEEAELQFLKDARNKAMQASEEPAKAAPAEEEAKPAEPEAAKPAGPSYPTSSRNGPKNWDSIGADEEDDSSDVNLFFKKLYKGATPEQQRAMMKSFTESNGTSLSTDWNDVKDRKVETVPPEGVQAKKWE